jgi:hypothetical protein
VRRLVGNAAMGAVICWVISHAGIALAVPPAPGDVIPGDTKTDSIMPCQPPTPATLPNDGFALHPGQTFDRDTVSSSLLYITSKTQEHHYAERIPDECKPTTDTLVPNGTWLLITTHTHEHDVGADVPDPSLYRTITTIETRKDIVRFKTSDLLKEFKQHEKDVETKAAIIFGLLGSGAGGVASIVCVLNPPVCAAATVVGAILAIAFAADSAYAYWRALDPVDRSFHSIARPKRVTLPTVPAGLLAPAAARAVNTFSALSARRLSLERALATALNRIQGAHLAHANRYVALQKRAARTYAGALAKVLRQAPGALRTLRSALLVSGFPNPLIDQEALVREQATIAAQGLPAQVRHGLAAAGLGGMLLHMPTAAIADAPLSGVKPLHALDMLVDPRLLAAVAADARMLAAFARTGT